MREVPLRVDDDVDPPDHEPVYVGGSAPPTGRPPQDAVIHARSRGALFVGPHQPYLAHICDVLPELGEEGVQTCPLRDLVPGGAAAGRRATRPWTS